MTNKISLIIPTYRNPNVLDLCLKAAISNQENKNQIIVVVDGFYEESEDVLKRYSEDIDGIIFPENRGQQIAHNTGVAWADNEAIFIINDDNVLPRNWDSRLLSVYDPRLVISPNQIEPTPSIFKSFVIRDYGRNETEFQYDKFLTDEIGLGYNTFTPDGQTWPLFMSKKWFMACGGFDIAYPSPSVCDWDLFMKFELAGLKCVRWKGMHLYHFVSTVTKTPERLEEARNKEMASFDYFTYKWGFYPSLHSETNSKFPGTTFRGINFKPEWSK